MNLELGVLADSLTGRRLHLILMPTEGCNLRCTYCYEAFRLGRMKPWVVAGVKRLLRRRAEGLEQLTLSWFGGEPLLAIDVIEDVMRHVGRLCADVPSLTVASDMTTNATLLSREVAMRLLDLRVTGYQIALDGPRDWHDRKRVRPDGRGTFDRIWENVRGLRDIERPFRVVLRLHVDRANAPALPGLLDLLASELGADPRFEVFVRALGRFGGPHDEEIQTFGEEEEKAAVDAVRAQAAARGLRLMELPPGASICHAARGNSFLVRSDGALNKCTLALEHPSNRVGRLLEDGSVELHRARILPWLRGLPSGNAKQLACPMRGLAEVDRPPARGAGGLESVGRNEPPR